MTIVDATVDEAPPHRRATRSIRDLPAAERPRERLAMRGPGGLSAAELISVILGTGGGGRSAMEVAEDLVARHDGVRALSRASDTELAATPGLGGAKAARLAAAFELGRRSVAEWPTGRWTIRSPRDVFGQGMRARPCGATRRKLLSSYNARRRTGSASSTGAGPR